MTITIPSAANAVEAQQARQERLEELYHQDGRQDPSHTLHGLYTGLVQTTSTTTPENVMTDEFALFALQDGRKIAIRKSSITAFFPAKYSESTVIEYLSSDIEGVVVNEGFDKVCALLGVHTSQQEQS